MAAKSISSIPYASLHQCLKTDSRLSFSLETSSARKRAASSDEHVWWEAFDCLQGWNISGRRPDHTGTNTAVPGPVQHLGSYQSCRGMWRESQLLCCAHKLQWGHNLFEKNEGQIELSDVNCNKLLNLQKKMSLFWWISGDNHYVHFGL